MEIKNVNVDLNNAKNSEVQLSLTLDELSTIFANVYQLGINQGLTYELMHAVESVQLKILDTKN